jgi:hypothetical protein
MTATSPRVCASRDRRCVDLRRAIAACGNQGNGSGIGTGDNGMSDELTNSQIALLCGIGEFHLPELSSDQKRDLERLISGGL